MARAAAPTAAQLRALRELRKPRGGDAQRGVMLCPAPATSIEEFEALAMPQQARLMSASSEDRGEVGAAPKARDYSGGLTDVSSGYKKGAQP